MNQNFYIYNIKYKTISQIFLYQSKENPIIIKPGTKMNKSDLEDTTKEYLIKL